MKDKKSLEEMEFEEALEELEGILHALEDRNIRLKDTVEAFERAQKLSDLCSRQLLEAENRLRVFEESVGEGTSEEES